MRFQMTNLWHLPLVMILALSGIDDTILTNTIITSSSAGENQLMKLPPSGRNVTKERVQEVFRNDNVDEIVKTLVDMIRVLPDQTDNLAILQDLWRQNSYRYPDFDWDVINLEFVRLHIANVLVQAHRNQIVSVDLGEIRQFVLSGLRSADVAVRRKAIDTISLIDNPADVDRLVDIAQRDGNLLYRSAVHSLTTMCGPEASSGLDKLEALTTDSRLKEFLRDARAQWTDFQRRTNNAWCR